MYLLHFDQPFGHARHYMGWAAHLELRLARHGTENGANLMWHVAQAGITWRLARTWPGDRNLERKLKNHGHARKCPLCQESSRLG